MTSNIDLPPPAPKHLLSLLGGGTMLDDRDGSPTTALALALGEVWLTSSEGGAGPLDPERIRDRYDVARSRPLRDWSREHQVPCLRAESPGAST